jgi:hypothetical protein
VVHRAVGRGVHPGVAVVVAAVQKAAGGAGGGLTGPVVGRIQGAPAEVCIPISDGFVVQECWQLLGGKRWPWQHLYIFLRAQKCDCTSARRQNIHGKHLEKLKASAARIILP